MVCIQCYLPPILFMLYMKFIQPLVAPPIGKIVAYFRGTQAVQNESCPIRPSSSKKNKTVETNDGGDPVAKTKDE